METRENLAQGSTDAEAAVNEQAVVNAPEGASAANADNGDATGTHQEHIKEALELLYVHFPKAFIKEGDCKPLKIGILEDLKPLIADIEGLSISKVRAAVRIYTTRLRYFYSVREGAMRVDLNGNEVEAVTAEHAEYARTRFTEINAKRPSKPKKPQGRPFNKGGKRPFNKDGQDGERRGGFNRNNNGQRRNFNRDGQGYNNQRNFEPAKESDIRVGRVVFVSTERSYVKGTVAEELHGGNVSVTLTNGLPVNIPLSRVFLGQNNPRPKRNFNNNGQRGNFKNNGPRGGRPQGDHFHGNRQQGDRPQGERRFNSNRNNQGGNHGAQGGQA